MISVIICSRYKELSSILIENISATINTEYELIHIDNSGNNYSIFSAYNEGWKRSKYPYLCFVHEDVKFHTNNWGEKIINHLQQPNVGICGIAGRDLLTRVPASWKNKLSAAHFIQSYKGTTKRSKRRLIPAGYKANSRAVTVLDGVFLCMNRQLMETIHFDENLNGFHGYDFDICIQSVLNAKDNYVMYDVLLEHYSRGSSNAEYYQNLLLVYKKWQLNLPLDTMNKSDLNNKNYLLEEIKGIYKLYSKLKRRSFETEKIRLEIDYFMNEIDPKNRKLTLLALRIKIGNIKNITKKTD